MTFSALVRSLGRSRLTEELLTKLAQTHELNLNGLARLPKGLVASAIAQVKTQHLCVITATLEEAGRWAVQLEAMGWTTVQFYPTAESSPYESFNLEAEMTWGQLQGLAELLNPSQPISQQSIALPYANQDKCFIGSKAERDLIRYI